MLLALAVVPGLTAAFDEAAPVLAVTQENESYWLRAYNGHIAVFFGREDAYPSIETTIEIDSLRDVDRLKLEQGIEAATYEDVLRLLEDFGS
jgi:hypothetical protein